MLLCAQESVKPKYQVFMLAIPTIFDLIATVLMNIGLLSVTASVYQMMRGAEMFFAAIFSVLFLHRRLNKFHLLGILCCVVRPAFQLLRQAENSLTSCPVARSFSVSL